MEPSECPGGTYDRKHGHRRLYELPQPHETGKTEETSCILADASSESQKKKLLSWINTSVIGRDLQFSGPFGTRQAVYCDYTASGKSLTFIEDYIRDEVLPHYGNTHTTISVTSLQTTLFRDEARSIIRNSVRASQEDAVLFVGSGSTAAIHKLIRALHFKEPPVVFLGPFEHHSVLLPWREIESKIIMVPENREGLLDANVLEAELQKWQNSQRRLLGCFSAASNVTGVLTDTTLITMLLHEYKALAIWDYSACAPYEVIDMNPVIPDDTQHHAHKDAIVFSTHKFVGGASTPGMLIAKKRLFVNPVPEYQGGGTVFFVNETDHRYLKEIENREEGGTAAIVECIRAGLVFRLKDAVDAEYIMKKDRAIVTRVRSSLENVTNLVLLGNLRVPRVPIFSFVIKHPQTNRILHHNFISALLNDLFGIQSRSGCACAGPYAQRLLGIDWYLAQEIESFLLEDPRLQMHRWEVEFSQREVFRPGFVRVNFPYFFADEEIDFVCDALQLVAEHGWKLLPLYRINPETGEWRHQDNTVFQDRKWLSAVKFTENGIDYPRNSSTDPSPRNFSEVLAAARGIFDDAVRTAYRTHLTDQDVAFDEKTAKLRWFLLPSEARRLLCNIAPLPVRGCLPFEPRPYGPTSFPDRSSAEKCLTENGACLLRARTSLSDIDDDAKKTPVVLNGNSVGSKAKWHSPPKLIWKAMLTAVSEFGMLKDGDKVLVCLSGGKDSLSLLHSMRQYKFYGKSLGTNIEFGAVTVDPMSSSFDPTPLIPYLKALNVPYFYEKQGIMDQAAALDECNSICSFCSRMKRGRLYHCARREGYNVLAFGQHLDDLAESFLMSIFHNGRLRTMKACYTVVEGDLRMIRPFVYVREKDTRQFAESRHLPVIADNCPACFVTPKERFRVKQLLAAQELLYPGLYDSLKTAMKPLMSIKTAGAENGINQISAILDDLFRGNLKDYLAQSEKSDGVEED